MNKFDKIKKFCRSFRLAIGSLLIMTGIITGIAWFYLGLIPLIAGALNFCPICIATKKCSA